MSTAFTREFIDAKSCCKIHRPVICKKNVLDILRKQKLIARNVEVFSRSFEPKSRDGESVGCHTEDSDYLEDVQGETAELLMCSWKTRVQWNEEESTKVQSAVAIVDILLNNT